MMNNEMNNELQDPVIGSNVEVKTNSLKRILFADYSMLSHHSGYVLFVLALTLLYIHNGHVYEKKARAISKEMHEITDIEYEYKYVLQEWTLKTKESELEKTMQEKGITGASIPPYRIKQ